MPHSPCHCHGHGAGRAIRRRWRAEQCGGQPFGDLAELVEVLGAEDSCCDVGQPVTEASLLELQLENLQEQAGLLEIVELPMLDCEAELSDSGASDDDDGSGPEVAGRSQSPLRADQAVIATPVSALLLGGCCLWSTTTAASAMKLAALLACATAGAGGKGLGGYAAPLAQLGRARQQVVSGLRGAGVPALILSTVAEVDIQQFAATVAEPFLAGAGASMADGTRCAVLCCAVATSGGA
jgi:hypothetical protein